MVETGTPYPVSADATGFAWREHVLVGEVNDCNCFHAYGSVAGHAGLFSTARDLLRFGDALLARAGGPFEGPAAERFLRAAPTPHRAWGFGAGRASADPPGATAASPGSRSRSSPELERASRS